jgi:hypothetical protein
MPVEARPTFTLAGTTEDTLEAAAALAVTSGSLALGSR